MFLSPSSAGADGGITPALFVAAQPAQSANTKAFASLPCFLMVFSFRFCFLGAHHERHQF
jgi:hypothetical protein